MADPTKFDFSDVPCPMPDCGSPLHLTWELGRPLYAGDLVDGQAIPAEDYVGTWSVACELGHVVLTPTEWASCDCEVDCACDVDASEETRTFRASDIARLAALIKTLGGTDG